MKISHVYLIWNIVVYRPNIHQTEPKINIFQERFPTSSLKKASIIPLSAKSKWLPANSGSFIQKNGQQADKNSMNFSPQMEWGTG